MSVREHLENALASSAPADRAGIRAEIYGPALPTLAVHAWTVFGRLDRQRAYSSAGPQSLTDRALLDHCTLTGDTLTPCDVALIEAADDAKARAYLERTARASDTSATLAT